MDEHLFVDRTDGMAAHIWYRADDACNPWTVRIIDTDSDNTVELRRFASVEAAHQFIRRCLPNVEI